MVSVISETSGKEALFSSGSARPPHLYCVLTLEHFVQKSLLCSPALNGDPHLLAVERRWSKNDNVFLSIITFFGQYLQLPVVPCQHFPACPCIFCIHSCCLSSSTLTDCFWAFVTSNIFLHSVPLLKLQYNLLPNIFFINKAFSLTFKERRSIKQFFAID